MVRMVSADRFTAQLCRDSYWTFFKEMWSTVAAERFRPGWHVKELCDELQFLTEQIILDKPKPYDLVWNCPPGTTKSKVASVLWQPWIWTRMPTFRMITGSYTERLSLDLARQTRDCITSEKYQRLFPEIQFREDQNTKSFFMNRQGGWRFATGVGGSVMGMHAHAIVIDDPIDPIGALSDLLMAEANLWITETLADRKVDKQVVPTILIMQRLHQNDPSGHMMERGKERVKHVCLPVENSWPIKPPEWKERYDKAEGLLDPERHPWSYIEGEAKPRGEAFYAGQFGQQPVPRGGALFKVDYFRIRNDPPTKWKRGPFRYWDKAATPGGGARTAGVKMALDAEDQIWILDCIKGQWDSGTRERRILQAAKFDGRPTKIGIEQEPAGSGKEAAQNAAKRYSLKGYRVKIDPVRGSKEARAEDFSVQVNLGNVILLAGPWNRDFIEEYRYFPVSRFKDQVDAGSGAYSMLVSPRIRIGAL